MEIILPSENEESKLLEINGQAITMARSLLCHRQRVLVQNQIFQADMILMDRFKHGYVKTSIFCMRTSKTLIVQRICKAVTAPSMFEALEIKHHSCIRFFQLVKILTRILRQAKSNVHKMAKLAVLTYWIN